VHVERAADPTELVEFFLATSVLWVDAKVATVSEDCGEHKLRSIVLQALDGGNVVVVGSIGNRWPAVDQANSKLQNPERRTV
jgi:hypothetical protein